MLRLGTDENFNQHLIRGLLRIKPDLDLVQVQSVGLQGADDPTVLEWAAREGRVLLTHDVTTITHFAYTRLAAGQAMPGVFAVHATAPLGRVLADILLLVEASVEGEWAGQIRYVPL